ncbi:MAG: hypothetical protein K1X47_06430 [Cyclobacteriaceae bacterium]|nr:hypothetical protein [Cyclobacteriaceae bacterium]
MVKAARNSVFFIACLLAFVTGSTRGQGSLLDKPVTLVVRNEPLSVVLEAIARQGDFSFSYSPAVVAAERQVTIQSSGRTVREVLDELFHGTVVYKEKARHIILKPAPAPSPRTNFSVQGGVTDPQGRALPDVSIYERESLAATVTDDSGQFRLVVPGRDLIVLQVRKEHYRDTVIEVTSGEHDKLAVRLTPVVPDTTSVRKVDQPATPPDTIQHEELEMPYESNAYVRNIRDTLYRDIQISVLPFVGTNGRLSGNVINNFSINILGGYALGTRTIELGFFVNMDRGDVSFLQIAGMGNLVGRHVYGVQAAGFFNVNGGNVQAVQGAGFTNVNFGEMTGVQMAGFFNANLQATHGVQVAGFGNYSGGSGGGVQIAGFANVGLGEYHGSQISGFANFNTGGIHGTQLAGFANITTGSVKGSQLSAGINFAHRLKGTQIGLFNFADSVGGVPIGLISFVNKGYHKIEVSADEVFPANLAFRTGVRKFYNILLAGVKPMPLPDGNQVWTYGYGVGTASRITRWLYMNTDVTAQHVMKGNQTNALSLLSKIHVGLDFQVTRKLSLYAGVTLNGYLTDPAFTDYPVLFSGRGPVELYDGAVGNRHLTVWPGWKAALRIL